jgi:hypothetical protein
LIFCGKIGLARGLLENAWEGASESGCAPTESIAADKVSCVGNPLKVVNGTLRHPVARGQCAIARVVQSKGFTNAGRP